MVSFYSKGKPAYQADNNGLTPLCMAAAMGKVDCVKALLKGKAASSQRWVGTPR